MEHMFCGAHEEPQPPEGSPEGSLRKVEPWPLFPQHLKRSSSHTLTAEPSLLAGGALPSTSGATGLPQKMLRRPGPQAQPIHQRASDERCPKAADGESQSSGRYIWVREDPRLCVHSPKQEDQEEVSPEGAYMVEAHERTTSEDVFRSLDI